MRLLAVSTLGLFSFGFAAAQQDQPPKFKSGIDLVTAAVVVRDAQGRAAGNLHAEDFAVFDKGKPQKITLFRVEHMTAPPAPTTGKTGQVATEPAERDRSTPERFVAYVFDDLRIGADTFMRLREAARQHMAALRPGDHAAIFTTSNTVLRNFTTSTNELQQTLLKLSPGRMEGGHCPDLSFYEADLILNKKDTDATMAALYEAQSCSGQVASFSVNSVPDIASSSDPLSASIAGAARSILAAGNSWSTNSLEMLASVVGLLSDAPGQRILVLASPGFLTPQANLQKDALMDRALRNQVVISSLDARGLYADSGLAITKHNAYVRGGPLVNFPYAKVKGDLASQAARAETNVLAELADGTGGTLFENNNDLAAGFRQVAGAPEYLYLIGFTPVKLRLDGSFHPLKVELINQPELKIESARKGYNAGQNQ
jgi:VWFA-related protein